MFFEINVLYSQRFYEYEINGSCSYMHVHLKCSEVKELVLPSDPIFNATLRKSELNTLLTHSAPFSFFTRIAHRSLIKCAAASAAGGVLN